MWWKKHSSSQWSTRSNFRLSSLMQTTRTIRGHRIKSKCLPTAWSSKTCHRIQNIQSKQNWSAVARWQRTICLAHRKRTVSIQWWVGAKENEKTLFALEAETIKFLIEEDKVVETYVTHWQGLEELSHDKQECRLFYDVGLFVQRKISYLTSYEYMWYFRYNIAHDSIRST